MSSESSKPSHPSLSQLPDSPSASDVAALVDQLDDFRRSLWALAVQSDRTRAARQAYVVREVLGGVLTPLNDLRRVLSLGSTGTPVAMNGALADSSDAADDR